MKTAEELYSYCVNNGYGRGFSKGNSLKHFQVVVDSLMSGEDIKAVFIGLHNYISPTKHDNNFAYALTNKRIIMGQKKVIGQSVQVIDINNINDLTYSTGMVFGIITIDSFKERVNVAIDKKTAQNIYNAVHQVFYDIKNIGNMQQGNNLVESSANQLIELKKLVDAGILTQEEFEAKKKQILGI